MSGAVSPELIAQLQQAATDSASTNTGGAGATMYGAMVPGVPMGSEQAAMLSEQTGPFGLLGMGKTMESAATADGLSPMQQAGGKYGGGLLSGLGSDKTKQFALGMGATLMQPQKPVQPPQPRGGGGEVKGQTWLELSEQYRDEQERRRRLALLTRGGR